MRAFVAVTDGDWYQYLAARPGDKVLLVSQMHVAIDNAITRLHRSGVTAVVRLSSRDDNVDPEAAHMLLSKKLAAWAAQVAERAREGLSALAQRPGNAAVWNGPYLKTGAVPTDPWGHVYQYRSPGERGPYEIVSMGSDGQEGGAGTAADISNDAATNRQ